MTILPNLPEVASRDTWLAARKALLAKEKALTRERDEVNAERRRLPMVRIDKPYAFAGPRRAGAPDRPVRGPAPAHRLSLHVRSGLEGGLSLLLARDRQRRPLAHLHARDTSLALVSRAPLERIEPFRRRMGWTLPWYSSHGSDFNYDFDMSQDDESVAPVRYNYADKAELVQKGEDYFIAGESHGVERLPA